MVPTDDIPDDGVSKWLASLPRESAPDIAVDALFERLERVRRRVRVKASLAVIALAGLGLWWLWPAPRTDAPIYLNVRIVDVEVGVAGAGPDAEARPDAGDEPGPSLGAPGTEDGP